MPKTTAEPFVHVGDPEPAGFGWEVPGMVPGRLAQLQLLEAPEAARLAARPGNVRLGPKNAHIGMHPADAGVRCCGASLPSW